MDNKIVLFYGWAFDLRAFKHSPVYYKLIDYKTVKDIGQYNTYLIWSLGLRKFEKHMPQNLNGKKITIVNSPIKLDKRHSDNFLKNMRQNPQKALTRFYKLAFKGNSNDYETFKKNCLKQYINNFTLTLIEELEELLKPFSSFEKLKDADIKIFISQKDYIVPPHKTLELAKRLNIPPSYIDTSHFPPLSQIVKD